MENRRNEMKEWFEQAMELNRMMNRFQEEAEKRKDILEELRNRVFDVFVDMMIEPIRIVQSTVPETEGLTLGHLYIVVTNFCEQLIDMLSDVGYRSELMNYLAKRLKKEGVKFYV